MTTIASLRVALSVDPTKLKSGLSKASASVKAFAKDAARITAGAAAAATAVAVLARKSLLGVDALNQLSKRTGISIESLTALRHAGEIVGVELEDIGEAFQELQVKIGEAKQGNEGFIKTFRDLGINFRALATLSPERQIGILADQLNKVADSSIRQALGEQLLSDDYRKLIPLLQQGSAGLQKLARDNARLGGERTGAEGLITEKTISSFSRLSGLVRNLSESFALLLAEPLSRFADFFTTSIPIAVEFAKIAIGDFSKFTTAAFGEIELPAFDFLALFAHIRSEIVKTGNTIGGLAVAFKALTSGEFKKALQILDDIPANAIAAGEASFGRTFETRRIARERAGQPGVSVVDFLNDSGRQTTLARLVAQQQAAASKILGERAGVLTEAQLRFDAVKRSQGIAVGAQSSAGNGESLTKLEGFGAQQVDQLRAIVRLFERQNGAVVQ